MTTCEEMKQSAPASRPSFTLLASQPASQPADFHHAVIAGGGGGEGRDKSMSKASRTRSSLMMRCLGLLLLLLVAIPHALGRLPDDSMCLKMNRLTNLEIYFKSTHKPQSIHLVLKGVNSSMGNFSKNPLVEDSADKFFERVDVMQNGSVSACLDAPSMWCWTVDAFARAWYCRS